MVWSSFTTKKKRYTINLIHHDLYEYTIAYIDDMIYHNQILLETFVNITYDYKAHEIHESTHPTLASSSKHMKKKAKIEENFKGIEKIKFMHLKLLHM